MLSEKNMVSVIIPVYDVENYLPACIESVARQTYANLEIIIVDDGSLDGSLKIAKEFAHRDDRIRAFSKKNGGVSSARNLGISKARGKYILFVDADDRVDADFIELLMKAATDNTMVICGFRYNSFNRDINMITKKNVTKKNFRFWMYADEAIGGFCCNKMYVRKIIIDNDLRFDENIKNCEDMIFNSKYFKYIDSFKILKCTPYFYLQRKNSATKVDKAIFYDEMMRAINTMRREDGLSKLDKLALDYMALELEIRCKKKINKHLMIKYCFDSRVPFSRRMKSLFYRVYKCAGLDRRKAL